MTLMLCERKLGGILTETKVQQGRILKRPVVGVGISKASSTRNRHQSAIFPSESVCSHASLEMLAAVTFGNSIR